MYKKLLIPLDGSSLAERALHCAVRLADLLDAKLLLLRVAELAPHIKHTQETEVEAVTAAEEYLEEVRRVIVSMEGSFAPARIELFTSFGKPEQQIVEIARREKADMLVMTTHGRTGFFRLVLGSISAGVIHNCHLPIVLISPLVPESSELLEEALLETTTLSEDKKTRRLLVTVDGTLKSEAVLEPATTLAKQMGGEIILLTVANPRIPFVPLDNDKEVREENVNYLEDLAQEVIAEGINCVKEVRLGNPVDEIVDYAHRSHVCMLVMATHARAGLGQMLLGSVATEVVRRSNLPVLMVHTYGD